MKALSTTKSVSTLARYLAYVYALVLALLPFHAFFTTWLGSNWGHLDVFRIWKEVLLVATIPAAGYVALQTPRFMRWLRTSRLARAIVIYILLMIFLGMVALIRGHVNGPALIYGLLSNLRYLGFFLLTLVVATQSDLLARYWAKLVLWPAGLVIIFGLMQRFFLPADFLKHFGYGPRTIPAVATVDNKADYQRVQSTLRGANPLGAYLVVVTSTLVLLIRKHRKLAWFLAASLTVLFLSYSRSAYIGAALAVGTALFFSVNSKVWRRRGLLGGLVLVPVCLVVVAFLRNNPVLQNTLFHTDNSSSSATSSNADRAAALEAGWHDVLHEPLGRGPGTAGPASVRNNHPPRISENYFLQIGQEAGWLGLGLFITINVLVGAGLWRRRDETLTLALFASLMGLTVVNLLSHAWADDTLGLLWWGLAGIALAPSVQGVKTRGGKPAILDSRHKHESAKAKAADQRS